MTTQVSDSLAKLRSLVGDDAKAKFLGAVVGLRVSIPDNEGIPVNKIIDAMEANPLIPDEWIPERLNPYSMYLKLVTDIGAYSFNRLDDVPGFNREIHRGYKVILIQRDVKSNAPAEHRIFQLKKKDKTEELNDAKRNDGSLDESLIIQLERTSGDHNTDSEGGSTFAINIKSMPNTNQDNFLPYLMTLNRIFQERCQGIYGSTQVRDLVYNIILKKIKALRIDGIGGMYFIPPEQLVALHELVDTLKGCHQGISLVSFPVPLYQDERQTQNVVYQNVQPLIQISIEKRVEELQALVAKSTDGQGNVRKSTLSKREAEIALLRQELKGYRQDQLLLSDTLDDLLDELVEQLDETRLNLDNDSALDTEDGSSEE